ncbi:ATP-binding cassette domain-containing protein [Paenibacillus sp. FSL R7-0297]|uniref:ATP-binding cassette domain-containing protein n=1 Tax=Paenibacillus sp. FSL R7-0297 TaxID=2921680 RepID=UPI0030F9B3E5
MLGANGAGKTILMRMICGVLKPTRGTVFFGWKGCGGSRGGLSQSPRIPSAGFWILSRISPPRILCSMLPR